MPSLVVIMLIVGFPSLFEIGRLLGVDVSSKEVFYNRIWRHAKIGNQIAAKLTNQFYASRQQSAALSGWLAHPLNHIQPSRIPMCILANEPSMINLSIALLRVPGQKFFGIWRTSC